MTIFYSQIIFHNAKMYKTKCTLKKSLVANRKKKKRKKKEEEEEEKKMI